MFVLFINFHQEVQKTGQGVTGDKFKSTMQKEMERGRGKAEEGRRERSRPTRMKGREKIRLLDE